MNRYFIIENALGFYDVRLDARNGRSVYTAITYAEATEWIQRQNNIIKIGNMYITVTP